MGEVIDLPETFRVDMAVDLRGRERRVAEQLLDRAQVGAALEQVRRERVPQAVGVGDEPAERAGVEAAAAGREKEGVVRAPGELAAVRRGGTARRAATPPRRAGRPVPCRPSRARARAPARSRRPRGRARPPRRCAARPSRRARRARGCAARARPSASSASTIASTSARFGASGSRWGRRGPSDASGTRVGPSVKRRNERTAASFRAIVAGASPCRARPSSAA